MTVPDWFSNQNFNPNSIKSFYGGGAPVGQNNYMDSLNFAATRPMGGNTLGGLQQNGYTPLAMQNSGMQWGAPSNESGGGFFSMDAILGNSKTGQQGWGMPAISLATGLAGAYMGMKQYGLAKDAFKESKRQFQMNFDAQQQDYNRRISDASAERERYNQSFGIEGGPTQAEYMSKWGQGSNPNGNESSSTPRDRVPTGRLKGRAG